MKGIAAVTLLGFGFLVCQGCVAIKVEQLAVNAQREQPSVALKMYLKNPKKGEPAECFVGGSTVLYLKTQAGVFAPVFCSPTGSWVLEAVAPGTYKIEIGKQITVNGKMENVAGGRTKTFTLDPGKKAEVKVVLEKTPIGLIIVASVVVVVIVVVVVLMLASHDALEPPLAGPKPPKLDRVPVLPPPTVSPGPGPPLVVIDVHGPIGPGPVPDEPVPTAPAPMRLHPAPGSTDIALDTALSCSFATAMDDTAVAESAGLTVVGGKSGLVKGTSHYDLARRTLEFIPAAAFSPGETVLARVTGRFVRAENGELVPCRYEWSFMTALDMVTP